MFKLTLLCAAAGFSSATAITSVTGSWEDNKHLGSGRGGIWLCGSHTAAVTSGPTNKITYTYPANEILVTAMGNTQGTDYTYHEGAANAGLAGAKGATATSGAVCVHTVASNTGTIVCNTVAVPASGFSCLKLKKAYPIKDTITHASITIVSTTDTTPGASPGPLTVFTAAFGGTTTLTAPTEDGVINGTEGTLKISFTPNADITTAMRVTVGAPGYTFLKGAQCGFGTTTKSTATTADSIGFIPFTPAAASGTSATYVECTKFVASSMITQPVFSVWVGATDFLTSSQGAFVTGKNVKTKAPTAKPTAFSAASQVSYNAVFIGALVAASLFLI